MFADARSRVREGFSRYLWWTTGCVAILAVVFAFYGRAARRIPEACEQRYQSYLLADELRHCLFLTAREKGRVMTSEQEIEIPRLKQSPPTTESCN